jgi:hypothetical protein
VIISPDVVAARSIDGAGCMVPENEQGQPSQDSAPPDSSSDIEYNNADLDDLSPDPSMRNDQDTPHFSITGVGAGATRVPRIVGILLLPVHCFYCLHEHIRERAPPKPGLTI